MQRISNAEDKQYIIRIFDLDLSTLNLYTTNMKMIKPSTNVKYTIESWDGVKWIFEYECTFLTKLEEELEIMKKGQPKKNFRVIRSEWQVIYE